MVDNVTVQRSFPDKTKYNTRLGAMKSEFATWRPHLMDISTHLLPRNGRFFLQDRNRGDRRHNAIYDNTGTRALRVLRAGLMAGATSPAQPWGRYEVADKDLMKYQPVKQWLNLASTKTLDIFAGSNTYGALNTVYGELGGFGTGCLIQQDNFHNVTHLIQKTMGEFFLAQDGLKNVDTIYSEFQMQVSQMVDPRPDVGFGYSNCSTAVQQMYNAGTLDAWITIVHVIEPRYDRDPSKKDAKNMRWKSCYYERSGDEKKLLRESGFRFFPGLCPRWDIAGGDIYGNSPGMECLGDIKQLQHEQLRKGQGIDYQTLPPKQLPTSMKGREHETLPGGTAYYDQMTPNGGIRSQFNINLNLQHLLEDIQDVRGRIEDAFYKPVFMAFLNSDDPRKTATEVAEIHSEKLLQMGPVLERLHGELLSPLWANTFSRMIEARILPPPPPELQGQNLQVEFTSILAMAQRAVQTNSIDRFTGNLGQIAVWKPEIVDKFDADKWADIYGDILGVNPELIVSDKNVALIRNNRAQAQQAQAKAEGAAQAADTANKLGKVDLTKPNAATAVAAAQAAQSPAFAPAQQPFGAH